MNDNDEEAVYYCNKLFDAFRKPSSSNIAAQRSFCTRWSSAQTPSTATPWTIRWNVDGTRQRLPVIVRGCARACAFLARPPAFYAFESRQLLTESKPSVYGGGTEKRLWLWLRRWRPNCLLCTCCYALQNRYIATRISQNRMVSIQRDRDQHHRTRRWWIVQKAQEKACRIGEHWSGNGGRSRLFVRDFRLLEIINCDRCNFSTLMNKVKQNKITTCLRWTAMTK